MTNQPKWVLLANLGDVNPIDHGGYFVFKDTTGVCCEEAELLMPPVDDSDKEWKIYRFSLDRCTFIDGVLSDNKFHPAHCAWWATTPAKMKERPQDGKGLTDIASCCGIDEDELVEMFCSDDPIARAVAYQAVGEVHGFNNLDPYPLEMRASTVKARYRGAKYTKVKH